jgi:hypothetical protein
LNFVAKRFLWGSGKYEKKHTVPGENWASIRNMSLLSIVNICFLIMLTNFNLGLNVIGADLLSGTYNSFDTNWYQVVGSSLCVTLILFVFTVNGSNFAFHWMFACFRCCDRGGRCDQKRTKTLT